MLFCDGNLKVYKFGYYQPERMLLVVYNRACKVIWLFCSVVVMGFGTLAAVGILSFGVFQSGCCLTCKIRLWYVPAGVVFASV